MYSLSEYTRKIGKVLQNENLSLLIFVDGDQMDKNLLQRLKRVQLADFFHVFVTTGKGCAINSTITEYEPWFTWIEAASRLKDAADTAIVAQVFIALSWMQRPIPICVHTNDHFGRTLQTEVEGFGVLPDQRSVATAVGSSITNVGATCDLVNAVSMDLNLYVISELRQEQLPFEVRDLKYLLEAKVVDIDFVARAYPYSKAKIVAEIERRREVGQKVGTYKKDLPTPKLTPEEAYSESYQVLDDLKSLLEERLRISLGEIGHLFLLTPELRSTFCIGSWTQLLSHPTVLMYLSAEFTQQSKSVAYLQLINVKNYGYFSHLKSVDELDNDELIWVWRRFWKNCDLLEFAKLSGIPDKVFRNWLAGRERSPVSALAVRKWITQDEIDY